VDGSPRSDKAHQKEMKIYCNRPNVSSIYLHYTPRLK